MENKEELKICYSNILDLLDASSIIATFNYIFPESETSNSDAKDLFTKNIKEVEIESAAESYIIKVESAIDAYLSLISGDLLKWIAINRLKKDVELFGTIEKKDNKYFLDRLNGNLIKVKHKRRPEPVVIASISNIYEMLWLSLEVSYLVDVESNLIGSTDRNDILPHARRRTKPKRDDKLTLTQNELMYLFIKLGGKNLFTRTDKTHIARGIELLSGYSANKTREKGVDIKIDELRNIQEILDSISESIGKEIEQQSKSKQD